MNQGEFQAEFQISKSLLKYTIVLKSCGKVFLNNTEEVFNHYQNKWCYVKNDTFKDKAFKAAFRNTLGTSRLSKQREILSTPLYALKLD